MNLWGAILAAAALGVSLATLVTVVIVLRRPVEVEVTYPPPRPPRHSDRAPTWAERPGRRVQALVDDESAEYPPPDPWPPHGDPGPDEPGQSFTPVPGGMYVHNGSGAAPEAAPAGQYGHPYPAPPPGYDPGAWYPNGNQIMRTHVTPDLSRVAPGADGTWNPRDGGTPARPYVEPVQ